MSLLLEALRRAEASGAGAGASAAESATPPPAQPPQRWVEPVSAPIGTPARPRRLAVLVALAVAGAALLAAAGWWWMQPPAGGTALVAAPPVSQDEPSAAEPAAGEAEPPVAQSTATSPSALPAAPPAAPRMRGTASRSPDPRPAATTASDGVARPAAAAPAPIVRRSEPIEPPLAQAYAAWRAGRLEDAEQLYRQALDIDARQPDAALGLAAIAEARGQRDEAAAHYRRVLELEPDHPVALAALAELAAGGDAAAQESVLRHALARRPDAAALHTALGRLLAAQQRWSEAYQAFASAWQLQPSSAERAYDLAVALDRLRKPAAAARMYAQALALAAPGVGFDVDGARERLAALQAAAAAGVR